MTHEAKTNSSEDATSPQPIQAGYHPHPTAAGPITGDDARYMAYAGLVKLHASFVPPNPIYVCGMSVMLAKKNSVHAID